MAVVVFDVDEFRSTYPQFSDITDAQLQSFFDMACLLLNNTDKSVVQDETERKPLLYLLTCHFATLSQRGITVTGTVSSATEGSVSTSFDVANIPKNAWWYAQTACGSTYYLLTQKYRKGGKYFGYSRKH